MNVTLSTPAAGDLVGLGRKPRIMIAGEFSSGKSRLINALIGQSILPSNVTSTALPPVWLTGPGGEPCIVGLDGSVSTLDVDEMDFDLETTAFCVLSVDAPILEHVDLIDTPGNSDPNMPPEYWERMLPYADGLVWCSSAMQAWKQSEKANCALMPPDLLEHSLLVVTQADRMPDARSAEKVLRRVQRESKSILNDVVMGSALVPEDIAEIGRRILVMAATMPLRGRPEPIVDAMRAAVPVPPKPSALIDLSVPPIAGAPPSVRIEVPAEPAPPAEDFGAFAGAGDWGYAFELEPEPRAGVLHARHGDDDWRRGPEPEAHLANDRDASVGVEDGDRAVEAAADDLDAGPAEDAWRHEPEVAAEPAQMAGDADTFVGVAVEEQAFEAEPEAAADDLDAGPAEDAWRREPEAEANPADDRDASVDVEDGDRAFEAEPEAAADDLDAGPAEDAWRHEPEVAAEPGPIGEDRDAVPPSELRPELRPEPLPAAATTTAATARDPGAAGGTSLLLPDGTVRDLWAGIISDHDLSDNERFLTCVSVLLSETRSLLRAGATSTSTSASS